MTDFFDKNQNLVRFDHFMQKALYDPQHGYYSRGDRVFGADGDFITAPEISPLFGQTIAGVIADAVEACGGHIWEFGAGRGLLARDILLALGKRVTCYHIVDVSGSLQAQQQATLQAAGIDTARQVVWETRLPTNLRGVVLGNEVLDAMPVRVFRKTPDGVLERHVTLRDGHPAWQDLPADDELRSHVQALEQAYGEWPTEYQSEWPEQAHAFVHTLTESLEGLALFIDYGFGAREFYHPQRSTGTLVAHSRHQMHADVLSDAAEQDLTAHVDYTSIYNALTACGGELLGYTSQAAFLLGGGLLERSTQTTASGQTTEQGDAPEDMAALGVRTKANMSASNNARRNHALQVLVSPAEMGELFKVIAWSRSVDPTAWQITALMEQIDRSRQI